jgi:cytochrome c oxidase cbb3-type subunit 3
MKSFSKLINEQTQKHGAKYILTGTALFFSLSMFAQGVVETATDSPYWMFSNTLFNVLLGVIVLLLIVIAVLGGVLKGVAEVTLSKTKNGGGLTAIALIIALSAISQNAMAQGTASASSSYSGLPAGLFFLMLMIIGFELIIAMVLVNSIKLLIKKEVKAEEVLKAEPSFLDKMNASISLEKEADIMMDHEYDGIRELDNDLPPWWKYGFYFSIVAAFIYLINFHIFKTGDLQEVEYNKSVLAAKLAKEEYAKNNANNVDENNVTMLTDAAEIEKGKSVFNDMCAACHGKAGQGGVGPNLTDDYWIHGGSLQDVFKSIKYGWPDKGMKSWEADLSPVQIHQISSFIKSIKGSNPADAKEPQGELFVEQASVVSDSVKADSVQTDSVAVKK